MGVMDDAVQDGVGQCGFSDHIVPGCHGQLGRDQRRFPAIAFLKDFQEIEALLISQRMCSPVVEYQQLNTSKLVDKAWEATVEPGKCEIFEEPWHPNVENRIVQARSLSTEGAGNPCFSGARLAGQDQILVRLQPGPLSQG